MGEMNQNADSPALKRALLALKDMRAKLDALERARREPIAVVGVGCRFPGGAVDPQSFWRALRNGVDGISVVPRDRWDVDALYDPDPDAPGKTYSRHGGFIDGVDRFDASFFGISPREAASMDPQQRLLLEVAWESLEDAAQDFARLQGSQTGVFVGISLNEYGRIQVQAGGTASFDAYSGTGNMNSVAAGRIAYALGLHGPTFSVDTACSSSLVAVQLAVQSLRQGACRMALAGGVNLMLMADAAIGMAKVRALSMQGRCATFDASADGYVRGEGCGMIVLKRLSDAQADDDRILAVIRGAAVNHDGRSGGLTVPNGQAQQAVIRAALDDAGVDPLEVSYAEAHGTGTALGDPIEVRALAAVLCEGRTRQRPLRLGSVKTNIGHLESAAGISALIKVILALAHRELPPHLHLKALSPHVDWEALPVSVPTELAGWDSTGPRIAGVNSFGLSGTNAHIVIEEAPEPAGADESDRAAAPQLLTLSGRTPEAVQALAAKLERHMGAERDSLADVCYTLNTGRAHHPFRVAMVANDAADARERLAALAAERDPSAAGIRAFTGVSRPKIAFVFTGQGSQYVGMSRGLYEAEPVFRAALDRCAAALSPVLRRDFLDVLFGRDAAAESLLNQTAWTQPALFAVEWSLAELWKSWGVEPAAVLGHSVGEYAAACTAGVLAVEDGLRLIAARGRLMQALPAGGRMVSLLTTAERARQAIAGASSVSIAAINGPDSVVISGSAAEVDAIVGGLAREGVTAKALNVSHAFHSPLMAPMLDAFEAEARRVPAAAPRLSVISNVTGDEEVRFDAAYWRAHIAAPVQFAAGVRAMIARGCSILVEIGPSPVLLGMARASLGEAGVALIPSLRPGRDDVRQMLEAAGELFVNGVAPDWIGIGGRRRKVSLPTYPFQRERFWCDSSAPAQPLAAPARDAASVHPLLGVRLRSPMLEDTVFQAEMSPSRTPSVRDHIIQGLCVFPATGYLEAMQAAARMASAEPFELTDVSIEEPLVLSDDLPRLVQTTVSASVDGVRQVRVFSAPAGEEADCTWTRHAQAKVVSGLPRQFASVDPGALRAAGAAVDVSGHYDAMSVRGLEYGPGYRALTSVWKGEGEALGRLELTSSAAAEVHGFMAHPGLLDAALQVTGAALAGDASDALFLPVGIARVTHHAAAGAAAWGHVRLQPDASRPDTIVGDVTLVDDTGAVVAALEGFTAKRVSPAVLARLGGARLDDWFYRVDWQEELLRPGPAAPGRWVVVARDPDAVGPLVERLGADSRTCTVVALDQAGAGGRNLADVEGVLRSLAGKDACGVVFAWTEWAGAADAGAAADPDAAAAEWFLAVVQAAAAAPGPIQLSIVTRGVQDAHGAVGERAAAIAPVIGLARVAASEHPELGCVRIDLDPHGTTFDWELCADELLNGASEPEVAFRTGRRFVRRLARAEQADAGERLALSAADGYRLGPSSRGVIDNIVVQPLTRREPQPGEIEVAVQAAGLNFRDVLNVLGMYPGEAGAIGGEFAGRVVAVGDGVSDFRIGDDVFGIAGGTFASHVTLDARTAVHRPAWMTLAEAASVPIAYVTAWYGLHDLASVKSGDRVLVHAAAGGVGIAATQIARRAGAEVFGTAGSADKRRFVRSLGVEQIFSSRTADFGPGLREATDGRGVDIVLNALTGDFISNSLAALRPGGTFLEIGKAEIWTAEQVRAVNPAANYRPYDLGELVLRDPARIGAILTQLVAAFENGSLQLMPLRTFELASIKTAFRYMAQARHIGKIVLTPPADHPQDAVDASGAYLITGGLGALGMRVGRLLADRGATRVFLAGRSDPGPESQAAIEEMRQGGADVRALRLDVASEADVRRVVAEIEAAGTPLRGIVHAAGVLDDGVLAEQNGERLRRVLAPKARGAAALARATAASGLRQFVMFSSVASLFGSPGQGPYAAANAHLDALAARRRALGLPGQSLNWGPWASSGMAARLSGGRRDRVDQTGFQLIPPDRGLAALLRALTTEHAQLAIMAVEWPKLLDPFADGQEPAFLRALAPAVRRQSRRGPARAAVPLSEQLAATPEPERLEVVTLFLRDQLAKVLGLQSGRSLNAHVPLLDFGLDSLMAVELRNALSTAVGRALPASLVFDHPTIDALAAYLLDVTGSGAERSQGASVPALPLPGDVSSLSDAEVHALLTTLIESDPAAGS